MTDENNDWKKLPHLPAEKATTDLELFELGLVLREQLSVEARVKVARLLVNHGAPSLEVLTSQVAWMRVSEGAPRAEQLATGMMASADAIDAYAFRLRNPPKDETHE